MKPSDKVYALGGDRTSPQRAIDLSPEDSGVPETVNGVLALRMARKSIELASETDALNLLLQALSDSAAGVSGTIPRAAVGGPAELRPGDARAVPRRSPRPHEWAHFFGDPARWALVGPDGGECPLAQLEVSNLPYRRWLSRQPGFRYRGANNTVPPYVPAPAVISQPPTGTGAPGRPTSMHLIEAEFERRAVSRQLAAAVSREAAALHEWMKQTHPGLPLPLPHTIENKIRGDYRRSKLSEKSEITPDIIDAP